MSKFKEEEKRNQAAFKANSPYFSDAARKEGIYKGNSYSFCLPRDYAHENLFPEVRHSILAYFSRNEIRWHDGQDDKPSNHLCDSQVCCANFLFPFADKPYPLAELLRPIFPTIQEMLSIEDEQYIAFEWIGQRNYLGEMTPRNGKRTRGACFTSADATIMFRHTDERKQMILIEWKYTESYSPTPLKYSRSKMRTDRTKIYSPLYNCEDCPLAKELLPSFDDLFFDPFYQLMRQQFLAHEMEKAHELGADIVSILHIAPDHNLDLKRITSSALQSLGTSATEVWRELVRIPGRFISISTEELFREFEVQRFPELKLWWEYITSRYTWLIG